MSKREREFDFDENWNVPESISFSSIYSVENRKKSIMHPLFNNERSDIETSFINYLESPNKVEWWFKNGDRDAIYFAVPYEEDGKKKPFYVDFIVRLKDGTIGLFDTKSGLTKQVAGPKVDGLHTYIREQNKKGKKIFGGIVTNTNNRKYAGRWVYFNKDGKELTGKLDNWTTLDF